MNSTTLRALNCLISLILHKSLFDTETIICDSVYPTDKHKPTNVGRIALERQARQFNSGAVA